MTYAASTTVPVDRTQTEIEKTLARYGATQFARGWDQKQSIIAFRMKDRHIKLTVPLPAWDYQKYRYPNLKEPWHHERTELSARKFWEQDCRRRWRSMLLIIKAKLEGIEAGITTLEDEFLAFTMLPNGATVGEWSRPQLDAVYTQGTMPALLPGGAPHDR